VSWGNLEFACPGRPEGLRYVPDLRVQNTLNPLTLITCVPRLPSELIPRKP
jgi:hypothetical protein